MSEVKKSPRAKLLDSAPWRPVEWNNFDAGSIQALIRGDASEHQQKHAIDFIITKLCRTYELSYRPDSVRDTDFAEGNRHVGLQLVKLANLQLSRFREGPSEQR